MIRERNLLLPLTCLTNPDINPGFLPRISNADSEMCVDDQTTMRHGIPLIAIKHFVEQHLTVAAVQSTLTSAEP